MNSNTVNHYNKNDIKVFYLVNGVKKEIFRDVDVPRMFEISSPINSESLYGLTLFLNDLSNEEIKTTYLQLIEKDTDTITHTLQKINNNNKIIEKV